jgi:hypothetical protein
MTQYIGRISADGLDDLGLGRERSGKGSGLKKMAITSIKLAVHTEILDFAKHDVNRFVSPVEIQDSADSREFFGSIWIGGRDLDSVAATSSIICSRKNSALGNMIEQGIENSSQESSNEGEHPGLTMATERNKTASNTYQSPLEEVCMDQVRDGNSLTLNFFRKFMTKQTVAKEIILQSSTFMENCAKEKLNDLGSLFKDLEEWIRAVEAKATAIKSSGIKAKSLEEILTYVQHYQNGWKSFQTEAHNLIQLCDTARTSFNDNLGYYNQLESIVEGFASQYSGTFSYVCNAHTSKTRPRQSLFADHFLLLLSVQFYDLLIRQEYQTISISFDKFIFHLEAIKSILDGTLCLLEECEMQRALNPQLQPQTTQAVFSSQMISQGKAFQVELEKQSPLKLFETSIASEMILYLRKQIPKTDQVTLNTVSHYFGSALYVLRTKSPFMQTCILCRSVGSGFPCLIVIDVG